MELEMQSSSLLNERSNDDVTAASCSDLADVVTDSTSKVFVDSDNGEVDEEVIFPSKLKKKKHFAVYDSDDDNEKPVPRPFSDDENQQPEPLLDEDSSQKHVKVKKSRIKPVWDSEEENENSADCTMKESLSSNLSNHSNDEDNSNSHSTQSSEYKKKKEKSDIFEDTLSENVNDGSDNQRSRDKPTWLSGEDSDSDANEGFSAKSDKKTHEKILKTPKEKRTPREGMEKIYSESQRMVRESSVCLPYHKPKQRSLLEFLNRKRVTPSSEDRIKPRPRDSSAAVVQVLEERAKEIEEFFKSDSEESENDEKKPSLLTNDKESLLPKQDCKQQDLISDATENQLESVEIPLSLSNADSQPMPQEMQEITNDWNQDMDICQEEDVNKITNQPMPHQIDNEIEKDPTLLLSEQSNDSWQDLSSAFSHKDIENIKRLSIAKVSKPTLHGRPGQLLDLDVEPVSTEQKAKVNSLIDRFVQQVTATKKSPKKKDVQISIVQKVMNADGQLELKRDVVNVPADNSSSEGISASAGRRQLLKDSLRQSMSAKRAVDRMKKIELQKVENEDYQSDKMDSEPEEEILSDEPETDIDEDEDDEDERLYREKRKKLKNIFVENEAEHSGESEDDDDEDDLATRIVHSDLSDEDDIIDRKPSTSQDINGEKQKDHRTEESISTNSDLKINFKGSGRLSSLEDLTPNLEYDSSQDDLILKLKSSYGVDNSVDELLALCSGKFTGATPGSFKTQNSLFQSNVDDEYEEEPKSFSRIVPMADDDDDSNGPSEATNFKLVMDNDVDGESVHAPVFSDDENGKSKPKRKKRSRICLSDDEDGNDDATSIVDEEDMHEEEREFRGLTDFFEDEAELSGSEVGSGDEREDEEDHWEEEEGDKEDIDENEVREQVGRAHMKTLLDQDQRDVRLFQELFLEDGDLHSEGGGRQRQFRWKNADGEDLEGEGVRANTQEDEIDAGADDQDDLTWRKMRSEREKWLQQQKSNQETKVDVPLVMKRNGKTVKVNTTPKLSVNHSDKTDSSTSVTALQTASPKKNKTITTLRRGSFLRRSEKDLSALASMTKSSALPVNAPKTGSNFVFASITPERPVEEKRKFKQEGSKAEPSNQNPAPAKKAKVCLNAKSIFSLM